jgi:hypothetical protein
MVEGHTQLSVVRRRPHDPRISLLIPQRNQSTVFGGIVYNAAGRYEPIAETTMCANYPRICVVRAQVRV